MNESMKKTLQDLLYRLPSEGQVEEIRDEIADVIKKAKEARGDHGALSDDEFESLERLADALEDAASWLASAMIAFDNALDEVSA